MSLLKKIWKNNSKHKKLCEDRSGSHILGSQLSLSPDAEPTERRFRLKYVGFVPAERACSAPAMAAAVSQAVIQSKHLGRKLRRVLVVVSPKGILVEDAATAEKLFEVSIYRISYCSADAAHSQVFAFIAGGPGETLECHAFLCPKRKMAQAATLAAAQSFNTAYQIWQGNQSNRLISSRKDAKDFNKATSEKPSDESLQRKASTPLIDLYTREDSPTNSPWVSFDEEAANELWQEAPMAKLQQSYQILS